MMYGYGGGWWMMLMPLLWIVLLGAIVWAVVELGRRRDSGSNAPRRESAREILDRRFASGEIDGEAYRQARQHLADPGTP